MLGVNVMSNQLLGGAEEAFPDSAPQGGSFRIKPRGLVHNVDNQAPVPDFRTRPRERIPCQVPAAVHHQLGLPQRTGRHIMPRFHPRRNNGPRGGITTDPPRRDLNRPGAGVECVGPFGKVERVVRERPHGPLQAPDVEHEGGFECPPGGA